MMNLIKFLFVAVLAITVVSCKPTEKKQTSEKVVELPQKLVTANIDIKGMTCEIGCAKTIESKISKIEGVTESKVDFENKKGVFVYDANKTSEDKLIATINNLVDGKTYQASKSHNSCKPGCEKPCCSANENKECKLNCEKKCCSQTSESKHCEPGCEKPCCKIEKKECKPGCKKACCDVENKNHHKGHDH